MLHIILLVFACACEVLGAFWSPNPTRVNLIALGLAFFFASLLPL